MKTFVPFSALLASVLAQGYSVQADDPYFYALSVRSASPIHFRSLQANGGKIYLGGTASGYCPAEAVGNATCAALPGNETTYAGGYGALSLGVVVPGGQMGKLYPSQLVRL